MDQNEIWKDHSSKIGIVDIIYSYNHPAAFQDELSRFLDDLCKTNHYNRIIEVGCESGITTMLLNNSLDKTFLDINNDILLKVEKACENLNIQGIFLKEDMFNMNCPDKYFDVVFNSGVMEHYVFKERVNILMEYKRILSDNGKIVIGVPNHFSFPYRIAYVFHKIILLGYRWPFPKEYKIFNLKNEIQDAGMILVDRFTMDKRTIFEFWNYLPPIKWILLLLNKYFRYEGYLSVIVIKKP